MDIAESFRPLLLITGPTGIGKTSVAMNIADAFPVDIISVDSVMIYKELNIGSAKPSLIELENYPHALVDILFPNQCFSAAQFIKTVHVAIEESWGKYRIPLLVGGSMLWIKLMLCGFGNLPAPDVDIRNKIREEAETDGWPALHSKLGMLDPVSAKLIHPNHSTRIERALEVFKITGKPISSYWEKISSPPRIGGVHPRISKLFLLPRDQKIFGVTLTKRFEVMLQSGLIDEVDYLRKKYDLSLGSQSMRSIGYKQVMSYLDGLFGVDEMKEKATKATRSLAKRQMTWLRSMDDNSSKFLIDEIPDFNSCVKWAESKIAH